MVDFPRDTALMVAGLEAWPEASGDGKSFRIYEERLQVKLGVNHFRLPPEFDENAYKIPFVRFPQWHHCPKCKQMEKVSIFRGGRELTCRFCEENIKRRIRLLPVRFVTVCTSGHIQDFPFNEWVHAYKGRSDTVSHQLSYSAGRSSTLSGITIKCSCGAWRTMGEAFQKGVFNKMKLKCSGHRPWFGQVDHDFGCNEDLQTSQRGASNIYFPIIYSSIYLPLWAEKTDKRIIDVLENPKTWARLTATLEDKKISRDVSEIIAEQNDLDTEDFYRAAQKKLEGTVHSTPSSEESFRHAEYQAFLDGRGDPNSDLMVEKIASESYSPWFRKYFKSVALIHKLRETRVLSGFTRLLPPGEAGTGEGNRNQDIRASTTINWLPAMIVRGEGIFIDLQEDVIEAWLKNPNVSARIEALLVKHNSERASRNLEPVFLSPKFFMIHSFAHSLISQLCFDCGYGSASLRERIYCNLGTDDQNMQGILIYTAAGDSEGTMGGLVRQGEPGKLETSILKAIQNMMWCSADPVCIESHGQGTSNSNLAACHNCCLLPETSCEKGNRYLDRALLVGTPEDKAIGLFADLLSET